MVRDYARHIVEFEAHCRDQRVTVSKTDKSTWRCAPCDGPLTVRYQVFSHDLSVRGAHLDTTHGFFNGVCVFVAVCGREDDAVTVDIEAPDGGRHWRVATSLPQDTAKEWTFGRYRASNYDELIDHPVEMGEFDVIDFFASDVLHQFVLTGRHNANGERLAAHAAAICQEHATMFGAFPDMPRYIFLTRVLGSGYGGLEHRASSSLMCSRRELPGDAPKIGKGYRRFLGLVSHEYFHLWNVKRIRPAVFTPYSLESESYTRQLWVFEGVTSYYDDLALVRSGVIEPEAYFELLSDNLARVLSVPGHQRQSLADSSFDAWIKFYLPTENTPNAVVSYYAKGALAALALDITIRSRSGGDATLDDVMRAMWKNYGSRGAGVPEDGFEELAAHVTGIDLRPFFDRAIRSTEVLDMDSVFDTVGLRLVSMDGDAPAASLGFKLRKGSVSVGTVFNDGAAEEAGLSPGDQLVALDGIRVTSADWQAAISGYRPGDSATLHVFRRDELLALDVRFQSPGERRWKVEKNPQASRDQIDRRKAWLAAARPALAEGN